MKKAYAIILAGGNGERLWPVSRAERPKQFVDIFDGKALIRHAVDRLAGMIPPERTFVITAEKFVGLTRRTLPMIPRMNIIGEPCRRDTAAAVAVACGLVKRKGGADAIGCVLTSDHLMRPISKFRQALTDCVRAASVSDSIVTLGIRPSYPATGYGYIEVAGSAGIRSKTAFNGVRRFVEKPNAVLAKKYCSSGKFLWNAGMFFWKVSTMQRAFDCYASDIGMLIDRVAEAKKVKDMLKEHYPKIRATSVDYAIMEKAKNILVAKADFLWDDVGSWMAVANHFGCDRDGNTCLGRVATLDVRNTVLVSDDEHVVAVAGLSNIVVVHTKHATLVCTKKALESMREIARLAQTK